jgi:hypothetical protein
MFPYQRSAFLIEVHGHISYLPRGKDIRFAWRQDSALGQKSPIKYGGYIEDPK